ncbi:MAG: serine--tRNA ligase [Acidobacteriota bacterium]|nr:serine--tRNA ligase [Acidobacteriota bacterium]MDE3107626.1 serine--tRNA ligase [Acidobacteriota bacterium]MDE3222363.1 serine--tRNA ligase [Acidobacteriota bacterium]
MIDLVQLRREPDEIKAALARRGVSSATMDEVIVLDVEHRRLLQEAESLRAEIKDLSRQVGEARRDQDTDRAESLTARSRALGDEERAAREATDRVAASLREALLMIPNVPADDVPEGLDENDNVEIDRWWVGKEEGQPFPEYAPHQRVAHWDVGKELGILDLEAGARLAGSMFPLYRGAGARLLRALGAFALDAHLDDYEEIRPPSFALTETMTSTGHLPKSQDDMYAIPRDDLWAIPTAEVPLTSMHRGEILDESRLPIRLTAQTACFRREAGAAGRDTRGLLRVHEFDKVELFAYCTPEQADAAHADILARAEGLLRSLGLTYRLLRLCTGDLGSSSARTIDLEVFSPGVDRWLEVSSVSWFRDYQARRANVRYRRADGTTALVHTVNGSALAWARIWAALVETYRQSDGTVQLPDVLSPYLGGRTRLTPKVS